MMWRATVSGIPQENSHSRTALGGHVIETAIEIRTPDGVSDGFLFRTEAAGRRPGVIHLTDIGGIRSSHRGMAQRLAEKGYVLLLPNVFYRTGRPPMFDFPFKPGEERSMKRLAELAGPLTPEAMERDASAYVDFLAAQDSVSDGPMGVLGHCFTGAMSMRTAAARPDKIAVAASLHGGNLFTDKPTSPHLALPRIKSRLYFGHAAQDRTMPQEAIENLDRALATWGGKYESEVYDGALHGWTVPDSPAYNQPQAERALGKLTELLAGTLR
jgi:carboxymethylenebutenolidase